MQKLLIVDDEPIIREGLKNIIPWSNYGYQVCDEGIDGYDGLEKIRTHQPDLVLLDIRMPGISGIELIRQVREENCDAHFIILTAYSSFSYAKELMGMGIKHYLLKPIHEQELIKVLEFIEQEKQRERELVEKMNRLREEKSYRALIHGQLNEVADQVFQHLHGKTLRVAKISNALKPCNERWLVEYASQHRQQMKLVQLEDHFILLFIDQEDAKIRQFINGLIRRVDRYGDDVVIMLGNPVHQPEDVATSFAQTCYLDYVHFVYSHQTYLSYEDFIHKQPEDIDIHTISKKKFYYYVKFGDVKNIKMKLHKLEKYFQSTINPPEKVKIDLTHWSLAVLSLIKNNHPTLSIPSQSTLVNRIQQHPNLQAMIDDLFDFFKMISSNLIREHEENENIIDKVQQFIQQYYFEDIRLKTVAEIFHYNSAYLGKLFKQETGIYFNDYVHQVRINQAKQLLQSNRYKVYEISKRVGYSHSDYFYKNFKKYEGLSPKEYQMNWRKTQGKNHRGFNYE